MNGLVKISIPSMLLEREKRLNGGDEVCEWADLWGEIDMDERLLGKWVSTGSDGQMTTIEFSPDGRLEFVFHGETKDQKMFLTYAVQDDILVTDQPSNPREERTKFELTDDGELVLVYDSAETVYRRVLRSG